MAQYVLQEAVDLNHEGKTLTYPKMMVHECVDSKKLVDEVASYTTFTRGELRGVIDEVVRRMLYHMSEGNSVKIDGLGVFTPSLAVAKSAKRPGKDGNPRNINANDIYVSHVNLRTDKTFVDELNRRIGLSKSGSKFVRRVSPYTEDERLELAKQYIQAKGLMRLADYVRFTGLSRSKAQRELKAWAQDKSTGITLSGVPPHSVYVLSGK